MQYPLLDVRQLALAISETTDLSGPGACWLRDCYFELRICSICGTPYFQYSKTGANCRQEPVCGNTCVQRRKRGWKPGKWFLQHAKNKDGQFPFTVGELLVNKHFDLVKAHLPSDLAVLNQFA